MRHNRNTSQLLLRLLLKAAWVRKDRAFTALVSVAVVATIATAALTIYSDLEGKLSREFRGFGANVVVTKTSGALTQSELAEISKVVGHAGEIVPVAYAAASLSDGGAKVVVGGADLEKLRSLNTSWSFEDRNQGNALVGSRVAESVSHGGSWQVAYGQAISSIAPRAVFTPAQTTIAASIFPSKTSFGLPASSPTQLWFAWKASRRKSTMLFPASALRCPVEVKPVRQITQAQTAVVGKTRSVVLASSAVVVILIMLCMVATFTGSVLERRKDFAVMKALGASNRTVNFLFASESALLALTGSIAGYILGCGIAFWIGKANFDAAILPQPLLLFPVLLGSVVLALIASTAPLRLLQQIQPAGILRGE